MRFCSILLLLLLSLTAHADPFGTRPAPLLSNAQSSGSEAFLPVEEAFKVQVLSQSPGEVRLRFRNEPGYYLYQHRLQFKVKPNDAGIVLKKPELPEGKAKSDDYFGNVVVYYGTTNVTLTFDNPQQLGFTLSTGYQGCADKGLCYPPQNTDFVITGAGGEKGIPWYQIGVCLLLGLGLAFTPCSLPMLPIVTSLVLRSQSGGRRGLVLALAYVLPMAAVYAALGVLVALFGAELNLAARLQSPWLLIPFAGFFVLFALAMFGLFELRLPQCIASPLSRVAEKTEGGSLAGAAVIGVVSALLVSPCISAPLAATLLYISTTGDALGGGLALFALGLGMGIPFVVLAAGGNALIPRSGPWMLMVRNLFGVLLLAVAIVLLERVLPVSLTQIAWGTLAAGIAVFMGTLELRPRNSLQKLGQVFGLFLLVFAGTSWFVALQSWRAMPIAPPVSVSSQTSGTARDSAWQTITTPQTLDQALAEARDQKLPVVLDWYADWCVSCKDIEARVFQDPKIASELSRYRLLRLNITANAPEQRSLLDRYGLFGPPAIQFFGADGEEAASLRVVGEIGPDTFEERLQAFQQARAL